MCTSQQLAQNINPQVVADDEYSSERWRKPTITGLEADLAYFSARLEFIGSKPKTINQRMQVAIFGSLAKSTTKILNRLRQHT
jgi:hypothetical protein